jgi:hypothetical protein
MTNTYADDAEYKTKLLEEIRCLRCANERILRALSEAQFPGYQMEKFSGSAEERKLAKNYGIIGIVSELNKIRTESEMILSKLNESLYVDFLMEKYINSSDLHVFRRACDDINREMDIKHATKIANIKLENGVD